MKKKHLHLDSKKRVTLGKLISKDVTGFFVEKMSDGTLVLHPVSHLDEAEKKLYKAKPFISSLQKSLLNIKKHLTMKIDKSFWQESAGDFYYTNESLKMIENLIAKNGKHFETIKNAIRTLKDTEKTELKNLRTKDNEAIFRSEKSPYTILWTKSGGKNIILTLGADL